MRHLYNNQKKKWRCQKVTAPSGSVWYRTGVSDTYHNRSFEREVAAHGWRVEMVEVPVFEARFHVEDAGDGVRLSDAEAIGSSPYVTSVGTVAEIIRAVAAGTVRGEAGALVGTFTLAKEGSRISLAPWHGAIPATLPVARPAGVPDLSAFVQTLGAPATGRR